MPPVIDIFSANLKKKHPFKVSCLIFLIKLFQAYVLIQELQLLLEFQVKCINKIYIYTSQKITHT